jgi:phosphoglucosamine mutase
MWRRVASVPVVTRRLFGTDGVRGRAGTELTAELATALGRAAVVVLGSTMGARPSVVVGRDTRASGVWLEEALVEGIVCAGGDALLVGVQPTPAIAFTTVDVGAMAGVAISASHNPASDNGIKFFSGDGHKLPDAVEDEIEAALPGPSGSVGRGESRPLESGTAYLDHLEAATLARLDGMRVVVDCANGAASSFTPALLTRLGADVTAINASPDGDNINDGCGALQPDVVAAEVVRLGADAGVSHDGDADRALFADASGNVIDGDQVLAATAVGLHEAGELTRNTLVATVMSNVGLERAMASHGIGLVRTRVGDRYVLEAMERDGYVLGGEQSGHVIFRAYATTGDGLLTAVRFLSLAAAKGVSVEELASVMRRYPQVLRNVRVSDKEAVAASDEVARAVAEAEHALGDDGRVLLRPSGTEPLVRVMVEAPTHDDAERHAAAIAEVVAAVAG